VSLFCTGLLIPLTLNSLQTQAEDEVGRQIWIDVNPRWYTTDNLKVTGEFGIRQDLNVQKWTRYVIKPAFAYSLVDGLDIGAGLGVHYTDNIAIEGVELDDHLAITPFQGLNYVHRVTDKWKINGYFRVEEKFDYDTSNWESLFSVRLRLRIRAMYEFAAYQKGRYYRLTLSWEGFRTASGVDGLITDRSKVTLGLERSYSHNQKGRVELSVQRQSLGLVSGDSTYDYSDIYLRLRYYPSWGEVARNRFRHSD